MKRSLNTSSSSVIGALSSTSEKSTSESGKKIFKNDFIYLQHFADAMRFVYNQLKSGELNNSLFYHLIMAGEIVYRAEPRPSKLSEKMYELLPKNECLMLVDMRDNYFTHGIYFLAKDEGKALACFGGTAAEPF